MLFWCWVGCVPWGRNLVTHFFVSGRIFFWAYSHTPNPNTLQPLKFKMSNTYVFNALCDGSASSDPAQRAFEDILAFHWEGQADIPLDLSSVNAISYTVASREDADGDATVEDPSTALGRYSHDSGGIDLSLLHDQQQYKDHVTRLMELVTQASDGNQISNGAQPLQNMFEAKTIGPVTIPQSGEAYDDLVRAFHATDSVNIGTNLLGIGAGDKISFTIKVACSMEGSDEDEEYEPFKKSLLDANGNALSDAEGVFRLRVTCVHTLP